jgi:hypothetical protein
MNTDELLNERRKTHGSFHVHARVTQSIKNVMSVEEGYDRLSQTQIESLHMIAHKIGRILAGNPNHKDHWDDIAGYAKLISRELETK